MEDQNRKEEIEKYATLQIKLESLLKQREELIERIEEIEESLEALEEVKENASSIFSIGSGAYCFGKIENSKILVNVGRNILVEMEKEEAKKILEKRRDAFYNLLQEVENQSLSLLSEQEKIAKKIRGV